MPVAGATLAVGAYGAHEASQASHDASDASQHATDESVALQQGMFDQVRGDLQPYMGQGTNALALLGKVNAGDYSGFDKSPDYLYAKDAAQYAVEHGAANAGSLYSGGTSLDLGREIAGIASQNFQGYRNNLLQLAGMGESAAAGVGAQGMGMASNVGNLLTGNASNQAGYFQNQADINGQLAAGVGGAFTNWYQGRSPTGNIAADGSAGGIAANGVDVNSMGSVAPPEYDWDWG